MDKPCALSKLNTWFKLFTWSQSRTHESLNRAQRPTLHLIIKQNTQTNSSLGQRQHRQIIHLVIEWNTLSNSSLGRRILRQTVHLVIDNTQAVDLVIK